MTKLFESRWLLRDDKYYVGIPGDGVCFCRKEVDEIWRIPSAACDIKIIAYDSYCHGSLAVQLDTEDWDVEMFVCRKCGNRNGWGGEDESE